MQHCQPMTVNTLIAVNSRPEDRPRLRPAKDSGVAARGKADPNVSGVAVTDSLFRLLPTGPRHQAAAGNPLVPFARIAYAQCRSRTGA